MLMRPFRRESLLAAFIVLAAVATSRAQEAGPTGPTGDLMPFETDSSTTALRDYPTPFTKELAQRVDWPLDKLEKIERKGFGRTEMISLVAIARKSRKSWDRLVKDRDKGVPLRSLAEEAGLVYLDVFRNSQKLKTEIDAVTLPLERERRKTAAAERAAGKKTP
jgi:hypothetical protein